MTEVMAPTIKRNVFMRTIGRISEESPTFMGIRINHAHSGTSIALSQTTMQDVKMVLDALSLMVGLKVTTIRICLKDGHARLKNNKLQVSHRPKVIRPGTTINVIVNIAHIITNRTFCRIVTNKMLPAAQVLNINNIYSISKRKETSLFCLMLVQPLVATFRSCQEIEI